jgi:hypothetical protein
MSTNPINNYLAIAFKDRVSIFGKLKNECDNLVDFDVSEALVKWSFNGKYLIISGKNKNIKKKDTYCIYAIDYLHYNTIKVIENIPYKITKLKLIDDRYLFYLLSDNIISGYFLEMVDGSHSLNELYKNDQRYILSNRKFPRIFYYSDKSHHYSTFDYDFSLKMLVVIEYSNHKMHLIIPKKGKHSHYEDIEINNCNLLQIKIIKEMKILVGGDDKGTLNIYNWPFKGYDYKPVVTLNENLRTYIRLDKEGIKTMITFRNYHTFITLFNNSNIFINDLLVNKEGTYKTFEYFTKRLKPQVELFFPIYSLYEMKKEDILKKDQNSKDLDDGTEKMKKIMDEDLKEIQDNYNSECKNMEENIRYNVNEEDVLSFDAESVLPACQGTVREA